MSENHSSWTWIVETLMDRGDSFGPTHHLSTCESYYHVVNTGPCNYDVLVTDKGIFYRPDTYYYKSPYGWRRLFY